MNALELADKLEQKALTADAMEYGFEVDFDEAATMLRQQQAEIEALKQIIDANNLSQNIGQFVKPANEPVAWLINGKLFEEYFRTSELDVIIPLYTHPVKDKPHPKCDEACMYLCQMRELTDEEIWELHQEHIDEVTCGHSMKTVGFIEFARAILRKAQEK